MDILDFVSGPGPGTREMMMSCIGRGEVGSHAACPKGEMEFVRGIVQVVGKLHYGECCPHVFEVVSCCVSR